MFKRIISLFLSLNFGLQQTVFAYTASLNLSGYFNQGPNLSVSDRFRPINLRYFSYQPLTNDFKILLDKGDYQEPSLHLRGAGGVDVLKQEASMLLDYFKIGLSLPNDKFWVNLRPDSEDEIIDDELAKTDLGKVMLEADLKLKQDTSLFTSPQSPQGKEYWNKLYKRAGELFGTENITIPTLTRPWIVPGEIILRESADKANNGSGANTEQGRSAYIYKANLKVMLEEDYLKSPSHKVTKSPNQLSEPNYQPLTSNYAFADPRLKELNQYSTQLIRELILPKLTQKVNSSKDYANLRQVYFSLILARWFKETFSSQFTAGSSENDSYIKLIDSKDLSSLTSKTPWDKTTYFNAYQKSFQEGEYNLSEPKYTPTGQVIRRYMSGGIRNLMPSTLKTNGAGTYVVTDNIVSSAIMRPATQIFFTEKELSQKHFIDSKKRVFAIFYPIDSSLNNLAEYVINFNNILGVNKDFLNEEEKGYIANLFKRIRENREQIDAIKNELREIPKGAAEPLTSLGAAWKILNKTQVFLIDEANNLLKITNAIQPMISYENGKYLDSRKDALNTIIKNLNGRALLIGEIDSEKDTLIDSLGNLKKTTVVVDAQCLLSYVDRDTNNINLSIVFNKNGDIILFSKHDVLDNNQPILKFKLGWDMPKEIETPHYLWESKINDLSPEGAYNLVGAIKEALNRATSSGSPLEIISAVEKLQDQLPDDVNEQVLKFIANVNPNEELEYPIKKDDPIMIGHVREDRAGYLARGLQEMGFEKLLGYIKFNKVFRGVSVLPEEAVGKISNTFFERIANQGYTSVKISEDEKKEHTGYNANGRNEQPFSGERRIVIKMQKSSKAYVDTPEMRMKEVADAVLTELDGKADFILTNFLSSDMMKHTGNFEAAKKSNEITDRQLGRIKEKIDAIREEITGEIKNIINANFPESEKLIHLSRLLNDDYDKFLKIVFKEDRYVYHLIKSLEKQVPLFVITADHGASEEGLKENPKESNNFHTANPVPYIIYDPLRKQKIPLRGGKTIRNNAATLLQLLGEEIPREYDESLLPADYQGSKRRIAFAVLDGWGINPDQSYPYDAIRLADTPNYDWFVENASFTKLQAHGEVIGLRKILSYEEGPHHLRGLQAGQTDIGHIHLFSGREVKQPIWYIDQLIKGGLSNGVFDETKEEVKLLIRELNEVKEKGLKFHYITIGSEGGVHASLYHMYALMRLAKKVGLAKDQFVVYFGADGRDVPTRTAHFYLQDVYKRIEEIGIGVIPVVFGRDMLVRKEGAENITNRLIDVLSGENLKGDDVTLVKETPQGPTTTGSPLTVKEFSQKLDKMLAQSVLPPGEFSRLMEMAAQLSAREEISEDIQEKIYAAISRISKEESKYILREKESSVRQARTIGSILTIIESGLNAYQVSEEIKLKLIKAIKQTVTINSEYSRHKLVDDVITAIKAGHIKTGKIKEFIKDAIMSYPSMKNVINFEQGEIAELLEKNERAGIFIASVRKAKEIIAEQGGYMLIDNLVRQSLFEAVTWDMMIKNIRIKELEEIIEGQFFRINQYFVNDSIKLFHDRLKKAEINKKRIILAHTVDNFKYGRIKVSIEEQKGWDQLRDFLAQGLIEYYLKAAQEVAENKQETQETVDTAKKVIQFLRNPAIKKYFHAELSIVASAWNKMKGSSSALTALERTLPEVVGGIDFRQMNMLIQPQGSFASSSLDFSLPALSKAEIESFDLDTELAALQKMALSGIAPSDERLKEYLAVCFARERTGREIDSLKLCLLDIFEQQQLEAKETPDGYKEVLVIADTRGYVIKEGRFAASPQNSYSLN